VIEKVGVEPEGVFRGQHPLPSGAHVDERHYAPLDERKLPSLQVEWGDPATGESM
jgi:hypothetical protein